MKKRAAVAVFLACTMLAYMRTPEAQAAPSALSHATAGHLTASLRSELQIADRQPELAPLVNSTYVLLDALEAALANNDVEAMKAAVEQYVDEVKLFQAAAFNPTCALPLALSLTGQLQSLLGIVSGGGTPLCMFIDLSDTLASILSTTLSYQICIIESGPDNATDNATVEALEQKQKGYKMFGLTTSLLYLVFCKRPIEVSDFISLFFEIYSLLAQ